MIYRGLLIAAACVAVAPASAWTGSARSGAYRVTAQLNGGNRLESVSLAGDGAAGGTPMQLHAWYVDAEGAILGMAPLSQASGAGPRLVALASNAPVPTQAKGLVVLAQPIGLYRTALATQSAVIAEIALP